MLCDFDDFYDDTYEEEDDAFLEMLDDCTRARLDDKDWWNYDPYFSELAHIDDEMEMWREIDEWERLQAMDDAIENHPISGWRARSICTKATEAFDEDTREPHRSWKSTSRAPAQFLRHRPKPDRAARRRINDVLITITAA